MDFSAAANEVVSFVSSHRVDVALFGVIAAIVTTGLGVPLRDRIIESRKLRELDAQWPEEKPIKLPSHTWERPGPR